MKHDMTGGCAFNPAEKQFLQRLRQHPQLWERFQSILELTRNADGPVKTADEMEELLIQELRALGNTSMNDFATQAEARVGEELKGRDTTVRSRKKKR
jgi:phosphoribosyl-dephospho-CoA transferase